MDLAASIRLLNTTTTVGLLSRETVRLNPVSEFLRKSVVAITRADFRLKPTVEIESAVEAVFLKIVCLIVVRVI